MAKRRNRKITVSGNDLGGTSSRWMTSQYHDGKGKWECLGSTSLPVSPSKTFLEVCLRTKDSMEDQGVPFGLADILVHGVAGLVSGKGRGLKVELAAYPGGKMLLGDACHRGRAELGLNPQIQVAINDFVAQAHAVNHPRIRRKRVTLVPGWSNPRHDCALLGPGTGLGVSKLVRDLVNPHFFTPEILQGSVASGRFTPSASEAGNIPFPVDSMKFEQNLGFLGWVEDVINERPEEYGKLDSGKRLPLRVEHVISGRGQCLAYEFFTQKRVSNKEVDNAIEAGEPKALDALNLWANYFGRATRTVAIMLSAWGAVYHSGGAAQKWKKFLKSRDANNAFVEGFLSGPTNPHQAYLEKTPVYLLTSEDIGVVGASVYGMRIAEERNLI